MELTLQHIDFLRSPAKQFAEHVESINVLINSRKLTTSGLFELEKYKEAVIDLFINNYLMKVCNDATPDAKAAPLQAQQDGK